MTKDEQILNLKSLVINLEHKTEQYEKALRFYEYIHEDDSLLIIEAKEALDKFANDKETT